MLANAKRLLRRYFPRRIHPSLITAPTPASREVAERFRRHLAACDWQPHPEYSVFTQYDYRYYRLLEREYRHKYRCFHCVAKTLAPQRLIELGTHAGSSADAYLCGSPETEYIGLDQFVEGLHSEHSGTPWKPMETAETLLRLRGFRFRLIRANLREVSTLPARADMVVVDAAHDFANEYADLQLALTADPEWIFVDDAADHPNAGRAIARFLAEDLKGRVDFTLPIDYIDGGLLIRLRPPAG